MSPRRKTLAISGSQWVLGEAPGLVLLPESAHFAPSLPPLANSPGTGLPHWITPAPGGSEVHDPPKQRSSGGAA